MSQKLLMQRVCAIHLFFSNSNNNQNKLCKSQHISLAVFLDSDQPEFLENWPNKVNEHKLSVSTISFQTSRQNETLQKKGLAVFGVLAGLVLSKMLRSEKWVKDKGLLPTIQPDLSDRRGIPGSFPRRHAWRIIKKLKKQFVLYQRSNIKETTIPIKNIRHALNTQVWKLQKGKIKKKS